jgi:hypothetical protein
MEDRQKTAPDDFPQPDVQELKEEQLDELAGGTTAGGGVAPPPPPR